MATIRSKLGAMHKSTVVWFNVVGGALFLYIDELIPALVDAIPALKDYLPTTTANKIAVALIVGNVMLRTFKTSAAIEKKP